MCELQRGKHWNVPAMNNDAPCSLAAIVSKMPSMLVGKYMSLYISGGGGEGRSSSSKRDIELSATGETDARWRGGVRDGEGGGGISRVYFRVCIFWRVQEGE